MLTLNVLQLKYKGRAKALYIIIRILLAFHALYP